MNNSPYVKKHADGKISLFSGLPEFGYELLSVLPFAYHLHTKGLLKDTSSGFDTSPFYYFSPNHTEIDGARSFENVKALKEAKFPNIDIHQSELDWSCFVPPPLKKQYADKAIRFSKETVVVFNRRNAEWGGDPVNFIGHETVKSIIKLLSGKYQIVYVDTSDFDSRYEDHAPFIREEIQEKIGGADIVTLRDLQKEYPHLSINELQLRVYAGASKFISSNGGLGILSAYFGGENIIFSKMCHELDPDVNSFYSWYYRIGGSSIHVVSTEENLLSLVKQKWHDNLPLFNVLIRTSGRPNYFHDCVRSILDQTYHNYRIIVASDDENDSYMDGLPCSKIKVKRHGDFPLGKRPEGDDYGIFFPYNDYMNALIEQAREGFIIYLDDDDKFSSDEALEELARMISANEADLVFWRVQFPSRVVPSDKSWNLRKPICKDISSIGFTHSAKYRPVWEPWKRADYRAANFVFKRAERVLWHNQVLTELQRKKQDGYGSRDDKIGIDLHVRPPLVVVVTAYKADIYLEGCLDSIVRGGEFLGDRFSVLVGVDGCRRTLAEAKRIIRKYHGKVRMFFSQENIGTYGMKNSLLTKVKRRDSLVFFFDSDDLLPVGFLEHYYNKYISQKASFKGIMRTRALDLNGDLITQALSCAQEPDVRLMSAASACLNSGDTLKAQKWLLAAHLTSVHSDVATAVLLSIEKVKTLSSRCKAGFVKDIPRSPHGAFFCSFVCLEIAGFFNIERVGQDTDLLERVKALKLGIAGAGLDDPWFVRRLHSGSLTGNESTAIGSRYRENIASISDQRRSDGCLVASGVSFGLSQIL